MTSSRGCIVPGSFDPITLGHMDIIERASRMFEQVFVAVMTHHEKRPRISVEQRVAMIERACSGLDNISVATNDGLLTEFARSLGTPVIVRGLRSSADLEYEMQVAAVYRQLAPELETVYLLAQPRFAHLSSSIVRQVAVLGGDIAGMLPAAIADDVRTALKG